ncbi:hypothetical protein L227DRAFT_567594 [Lentinus tigrinus ALCF2SS1-6]|uniref:Uncharacterized protein n=1 Tax=Lentinus tigrinus ALCF2SS1-6 TaxID=1328759 RepID=A0A5C2RQR0_9APHY|nr:hypothetical protein L227DRAFT_567594 [Lentinus tigrinus ALCF2SS1-6]
MSLLAPRFDFTVDRSDGRCALTTPSSQYPTSDSRHEHFVRPPPSWRAPAAPAWALSPTISRTVDNHPSPDLREVCPGVLPTGQLTDNHPLVNTYLEALARIIPRGPSKVSASSASTPTCASARFPAPATHSAGANPTQVVTYWQSEHAGIASWNTVSNVISQQFQLFPGPASRLYASEVPKLTARQQQAIFALAALKVLNHPTIPVHWAFWAKNTTMRTADTVEAILQLKPCPVQPAVGWIGKTENLWALRGLQSMYIPPEPKGMTLRKRRAPPATTPSAEIAEEPVEGRVSTRKRTRTTRASQKAKEAEAAQVADVVPEPEDGGGEEEASSLLFEETPAIPVFSGDSLPTLEMIEKAMKEDLTSGSPVLQAIEHLLGLNHPSTEFLLELPPPANQEVDAAPVASPSATRRSTRSRRKPAPPGPCSLMSTPLSTLSSPPSREASPLAPSSPEKTRSGSRGSSTAVSDAGYPSEDGTVVDAEIEAPSTSSKGKRKAAEIEDADANAVELHPSKSKTKKATSSSRKRAKLDEIDLASIVPQDVEGAIPEASGEENVPEISSVPATVAKKRKAATYGGKRKAARART